ncbi:MAG TPA: lipopolysaccharide heptosyltransferase I, partial [Rhizobiales bacterium]|nr:lipopolysaccharide heptosyltransferase I [Hyphomicrobiales bacterium]
RWSVREPLARLAYRHAYGVPRDLHAIARTRILFGRALGYEPDLSHLDNGIKAPPPPGPIRAAPTAFLLHGTSREAKKWPVANWIETAAALAGQGLIPLTTWSSAAERETAETIASAVPATIVLPKSPLEAVAGEIGRASLVIGADTGLMHLASAFALPTVAVFVATKPGLTGPLGPRSIALAPRDDDGVAVSRVLAAAAEMMAKGV